MPAFEEGDKGAAEVGAVRAPCAAADLTSNDVETHGQFGEIVGGLDLWDAHEPSHARRGGYI